MVSTHATGLQRNKRNNSLLCGKQRHQGKLGAYLRVSGLHKSLQRCKSRPNNPTFRAVQHLLHEVAKVHFDG